MRAVPGRHLHHQAPGADRHPPPTWFPPWPLSPLSPLPPPERCARSQRSHSKKQKRHVLLRSLAIYHFLPVAVTLALVLLNAKAAYIPWPGPSDSQLAAFQFGAKLHEILMTTSAAHIVYHWVVNELVSARGTRLGLLSSPYQFSSVPYFFSSSFRGAVFCWPTAETVARLNHVTLVGLLLLAALLALTVGPASAIMMLPRLDWWQLPDMGLANSDSVQGGVVADFATYVGTAFENLYPLTVSTKHIIPACVGADADVVTLSMLCPASGFPTIYPLLRSLVIDSSQTGYRLENVTIDSLDGRRVISGGSRQVLDNSTAILTLLAYATTPPDFLVSALNYASGQFQDETVDEVPWQYPFRIDTIEKTWNQPLVFMQCSRITSISMSSGAANGTANGTATETFTLPYGEGIHPAFNLTLNSSEARSVLRDLNASSTSAISWGGFRDAFPFPVSTTATIGGSDDYIQVCLVDAQWVPTDVSRISPGLEAPTENLPFDPVDVMDLQTPLSNHTLIRLQNDWLDALNTPFQLESPDLKTGALYNYTPYVTIPDICAVPFYVIFEEGCLGISLSVFLAEALSKVQNPFTSFRVWNDTGHPQPSFVDLVPLSGTGTPLAGGDVPLQDMLDPAKFTAVDLVFSHYVYGYGFRGVTIYIALAVLLLYVLLVLAHSALVLWLTDPGAGGAWFDMSNFLVLALRSSPPVLGCSTTRALASRIGRRGSWACLFEKGLRRISWNWLSRVNGREAMAVA